MGSVATVVEEASSSPRAVLVSEPPSDLDRRQVALVLISNSWMMGGMEAHIQSLGTGLARRGIRTIAILPASPKLNPLRDELTRAGAEVRELPAGGSGPVGRLLQLRQLARMIRSCGPSVVHIHISGMTGGTIQMLAAMLAGARAIIRTEHEPPSGTINFLKRAMTRARDLPLRQIICVSEANLEQHVRALSRDRRKFVAIPNSVSVETFRPSVATGDAVRRLAGATEDTIVVGTISRLVGARKGLEHFVDMARTLAAERSDYRFVVVGEGDRRAELERRAQGAVQFLGRYPDAAECYAAFDVFVMPSLWEGGPITVLEAMAMARPVVATAVGMVPEVIGDGVNGLIVPPGDSAALADAVRRLAADSALSSSMATRARASIMARYSESAVLDRLHALYRGACDR
jgi:glycosyltransferase involved in cell wall biosynthesis